MKKLTFKQTRPFQTEMFPQNGLTGQIKQSSHVKGLAGGRKVRTVNYEDSKSTWNSGVRKAIRQGSAEEKVRTHRDRMPAAENK